MDLVKAYRDFGHCVANWVLEFDCCVRPAQHCVGNTYSTRLIVYERASCFHRDDFVQSKKSTICACHCHSKYLQENSTKRESPNRASTFLHNSVHSPGFDQTVQHIQAFRC